MQFSGQVFRCRNEFKRVPTRNLIQPFFSTHLGSAYRGDALELLPDLADQSIDLICTSPPFALLRKKAYGNVHADDYIDWFMQFAREFRRVLKPHGSLVVDIGGTWVKGSPIRSLYHFELLLRLCKPVDEGGAGFMLAQESTGTILPNCRHLLNG